MQKVNNQKYTLTVTTQGPLYPPSEVMDDQGNFVVIGLVPEIDGIAWRGALVAPTTEVPEFGKTAPYKIIRNIEDMAQQELEKTVLYSLPLPIPLNNYGMDFAPEQRPDANKENRPSLALHDGYIADYRESDGKRHIKPITLYDWMKAKGELDISISEDGRKALFEFDFSNLVPNSVYTVMSLRERDLDINEPTRPGPLGIPNVFTTDFEGNGTFWAELFDPFPAHEKKGNRIINVVVLYMSGRQSYGGAIGLYGLGGDVHAHLKLKGRSFDEFSTSK